MNELVLAFRACLNTDVEVPPTPAQKQLVISAIRELGWRDKSIYSANPHDFHYRAGMQAMAIFIEDHINADPHQERQEVATHRPRN